MPWTTPSFNQSPIPRSPSRTRLGFFGGNQSSAQSSPSSSPVMPHMQDPRERRGSSASLPPPSPVLGFPLSRMTSTPNPSEPVPGSPPRIVNSHSASLASPSAATPRVIARSRSRSPRPSGLSASTPPNAPPTTWWGRVDIGVRPWLEKTPEKSIPEKKRSISIDHTEGWVHAQARVARAAASVLGTAADVGHELLFASVDVLQFAPVAGLTEAARVLLGIWDALQKVDLNRMACLRLTERCADILMSVREEIHEAGDEVAEELKEPIAKLVEALKAVHVFLQRQINLPFLKRYLKRDSILRDIQACDAGLNNALEMFSLSIQIRILKQVQRAEANRQSSLPQPLQGIAATAALPAVSADMFALPSDPASIRTTLRTLHKRQNAFDAANDIMDLRALMRTALQSSNDVEMIEVLQVGREEMPEAIKTLQRALERNGPVATNRINFNASDPQHHEISDDSEDSALSIGGARDMLDKEFMETGIDALRRMSMSKSGRIEHLPSWTITRYEVDREEKIGVGFFSDVYRGTWRNRIVAIKVLTDSTPRSLFLREINIWKTLSHPNVLELYGASSAHGDGPWFFVCKFCKGGSLVRYLKGLDEEVWNASIGNSGFASETRPKTDLLKMMLQVAKGMEYLHSQGVLHGDLKASNVLVDLLPGKARCILSDFGQSEMKSEAYRLSGTSPPHGTLRWQAPELMAGHHHSLTTEIDVYAFAISCTEILTKGSLPWPMADDDAVRHFVLKENLRPSFQRSRITTPALIELLSAAWHKDPFARPTFSWIVVEIKKIRAFAGLDNEESPRPPLQELQECDELPSRPSPDMHPVALPGDPTIVEVTAEADKSTSSDSSGSYTTAEDDPLDAALANVEISGSSSGQAYILPRPRTEDRGLGAGPVQAPLPVIYTPSIKSASVFTFDPESSSDDGEPDVDYQLDEGYDSPAPSDDRVAQFKNERRYRLLLSHDFHRSLTLPLWKPSPIAIGSVGYLMKPEGAFITLFNMFDPLKTSGGILQGFPSVYGYGKVSRKSMRQDRRNAALRGLDALQDFLTFKPKNDALYPKHISRRYSFALRAGHHAAHLCTESTTYRYVEDLEAPKNWFKAHVDAILQIYGAQHHIQKEDLYLVIGTLDARDYALYVSHKHPDGQLHFNVFSSPKPDDAWGTFTTDTESPRAEGPHYHEDVPGQSISASKVSVVGRTAPWDTVLVAKLRFRPDALDPTSL